MSKLKGLSTIHTAMTELAKVARLPIRALQHGGRIGNTIGTGIGSSIEFQEYKSYSYGDDIRHIDWRAYARTNQYTLKLFREEVTPLVDLVFDASPSMFLEYDKEKRALELLYLCLENALQIDASIRCYFICGNEMNEIPLPDLLGHQLSIPDSSPSFARPVLAQVPWRRQSIKLLISDLLFPGSPIEILSSISQARGVAIILAPYLAVEANPNWAGNVELLDCESGSLRKEHIDPAALENYCQGYQRHFGIWREEANKFGVKFSHISCEEPILRALEAHAFSDGAFEPCLF